LDVGLDDETVVTDRVGCVGTEAHSWTEEGTLLIEGDSEILALCVA
jgi:hypothetical protein